MKKPTIRELMKIGMYGFCVACIGGAIAVVADLNGQLYWARFGFVIVILGMIIAGAIVVFGFFMNLILNMNKVDKPVFSCFII